MDRLYKQYCAPLIVPVTFAYTSVASKVIFPPMLTGTLFAAYIPIIIIDNTSTNAEKSDINLFLMSFFRSF